MANMKFVLCALLLLCIAVEAFSTSSSSSSSTPYFPKALANEMAKRENRYHHYLWHNIREGWNRFSNASQEALRKLKWDPPRAARVYDANGVASAIPENGSGEDFLFMHRHMIGQANDFLKSINESFRITGWKTIPAPNNKSYPVPPQYNITGNSGLTDYTNYRKTDDYYYNTIAPMEKFLKDPVNLRNMTLGELGAKIEVNIHSWMHMRWSNASSYGYRPVNKSAIPASFDKKWDNPQYSWLGDTYSSHVDPIFWDLHGWVDDRIEDWRIAHNLTSIRWNGTWIGGPMSSFASILKKEELPIKTNLRVPSTNDEHAHTGSDGEVGDVMEQVMQILMQENAQEVSFADNVVDPTPTPIVENIKPKTLKPKAKLNKRKKSLCRSRFHGKKN